MTHRIAILIFAVLALAAPSFAADGDPCSEDHFDPIPSGGVTGYSGNVWCYKLSDAKTAAWTSTFDLYDVPNDEEIVDPSPDPESGLAAVPHNLRDLLASLTRGFGYRGVLTRGNAPEDGLWLNGGRPKHLRFKLALNDCTAGVITFTTADVMGGLEAPFLGSPSIDIAGYLATPQTSRGQFTVNADDESYGHIIIARGATLTCGAGADGITVHVIAEN